MINNYESLVDEALKQYGITNYTHEFIRHNENIVFKVKNKNDNKYYLLRIHEPITKNLQGIQHSLEGLNAETKILAQLTLRTDLVLQKPIKNKENSFVSTIIDTKNNNTSLCTLLTWIDGDVLTDNELNDKDVAYELGVLIAKMHNFSSDWEFPQPFIRPIYDIDKYIHLINRLAYGVQIGLYTKEQYEVVIQTMEKIKALFNSTNRTKENWGIIHADLNRGNIIVNKNIVSPIDFCFSGYGYYLFDLGISLGSFKTDLRQKVLEGYKSLRNISNDDYYFISACFILSILGAFGFNINNTKSHEWIKRRMPYVTSNYCMKFLNDESFILEID